MLCLSPSLPPGDNMLCTPLFTWECVWHPRVGVAVTGLTKHEAWGFKTKRFPLIPSEDGSSWSNSYVPSTHWSPWEVLCYSEGQNQRGSGVVRNQKYIKDLGKDTFHDIRISGEKKGGKLSRRVPCTLMQVVRIHSTVGSQGHRCTSFPQISLWVSWGRACTQGSWCLCTESKQGDSDLPLSTCLSRAVETPAH